jgi:translation initiation factor IF-2
MRKVELEKQVYDARTLSEKLQRPVNEVLLLLLKEGVASSVNDSFDFETASLIAGEMGFSVQSKEKEKDGPTSLDTLIKNTSSEEVEHLETRSPIVTIMGHVDHGKTTLLDRIRKTAVASGEAGGITQSIGAYQAKTRNGQVTFIDTPGHEAFRLMRQKGGEVTDVIILVVAANDGVRDQTKEVIKLARSTNTEIIVAINKIDVAGVNIDKVKTELAENGLVPDDWGGDTQMVKISAKMGQNIDELLDMTALISEIKELKASKKGKIIGSIIESRFDTRVGNLVSAIILNGTLKTGDTIKAGKEIARVRFLQDYKGNKVRSVGPSTPVMVSGFKNLPEVGDILVEYSGEGSESGGSKIVSVKSIRDAQTSEGASLDLIIKADTEGSLDALKSVLLMEKNEKVRINFVAEGVGFVTENDLHFAEDTGAYILGFNVDLTKSAEQKLRTLAKKNIIVLGNIIYRLSEKVQKAVDTLSKPDFLENILCEAEILKIFRYSNKGETLAGVRIKDGVLHKKDLLTLYRDNEKLNENIKINSLKIIREEMQEVKKGRECGLLFNTKVQPRQEDLLKVIKRVKVDKNNLFS